MNNLSVKETSTLEELNFKFQNEEKISNKLSSVSEWLLPKDNTEDSVIEVLDKVNAADGVDFSKNKKFNNKIAKRTNKTLLMSNIPSLEWTGDYVPQIISKTIPHNRMIRTLSEGAQKAYTVTELALKNGKKFMAITDKPYIKLIDNPIMYVDFVEDGDTDVAQHLAHLMCRDFILRGILVNGVRYFYVMSSASQLRQLKGVFVREDYRLPHAVISAISDPLYREYVEQLRGENAILEIMTYGAYSCQFSNLFATWLMKVKGLSVTEVMDKYPKIEIEEKLTSIAKFLARVGLSLSSSNPLGRTWKVKHIGSIKFKFSKKVEQLLRDETYIDEDGDVCPKYTEDMIANIKEFWKEDKIDGSAIMRASKFVQLHNKIYKTKLTVDDVVCELVHLRWGGTKGTALVLPDNVMDMCLTPDGQAIYEGFDLIVEDNSWKFSPMEEFYTGRIAPEFELVNMSKARYTNFFNSQFAGALDGDMDVPDNTVDAFKEIVDENCKVYMDALDDASVMKAKLGMTDSESYYDILDNIGVDKYEMTQKSKMAKILSVDPDAVHDPYVAEKFISNFEKNKDDIAAGKFEVQGGIRYVITDPSAFLRTDLAVMNDDGLWDIIIEDPDDVAINKPDRAWWDNRDCECVFFRAPELHPGEPQRRILVPDTFFKEELVTAYGTINIRGMFKKIKNLIVLSGWDNALEALGGADTDGDTLLCVIDQRIVNMRLWERPTLYVKIDSATTKQIVNAENIKLNMVASLKNNGIGLITDYATTWRDIQHYAIWCMANEKPLPKKISRGLYYCKCRAVENIAKHQLWVHEDKSIQALATMETSDPVSVYKTANIVLEKLRELQEMSINTAKSGIFVEFGCKDDSVNNYNHLAIKIRASWHRPFDDPKDPDSKVYASKSPLGQIHDYSILKWKELRTHAKEHAQSLFPNMDSYFDVDLMPVFKQVKELKKYYGNTVKDISVKKANYEITDDEFGNSFDRLTEDMHAELLSLALEYGTDKIAIMAYDCSYQDGKKGASGKSFVWNCFFDEFLDTLKYIKSQEGTAEDVRIYPVSILPGLDFNEVASGRIIVYCHSVFKDGVKIGYCYKEDGEYNMIVVEDRIYIEDTVEFKTIDELTASLNNMSFRLVGFKYYLDAVAGDGSKLDREKIVEYLGGSVGQMILRAHADKTEKFTSKPKVVFSMRTGDDEDGEPIWSPVGSLEETARNVGRALNGKIFSVNFNHDADLDAKGNVYGSRLSLVIDEVLMDEFQ